VATVLVTGGTGFLGANLVRSYNNQGHFVSVIGRDAERIQGMFGGTARAIQWNPLESGPWGSEAGRHQVVVHLAGEPAVGRRMHAAMRRSVRNSRVRSTRRLVDAMAESDHKPEVFLCASAVGYYGTSALGQPLDEASPVGTGFLAELCHEWESAALQAELFGVRVVLLRFGIVLDRRGGALGRLLPVFRLGLGGRLGGGQQSMPWVSMDDAIAAIQFCASHSTIRGPVNVVSPNNATNAQFTRALGHAVQRPAFLGVPAVALKLALGEGADALLQGAPVTPGVLLREGFEFKYPDLDLALTAALV
jgi:uncharacterized protein (TIGR01777 family)